MMELSFESADPRTDRCQAVLRKYLTEVGSRSGAPIGPHEAGDVGDFLPPTGSFFIVVVDDEARGCGAVRVLAPGIAELKRIWIDPAVRRTGIGRQLLEVLEKAALELGCATVRLDTHESLVEARSLYEACGYEPIPAYNENPDCTLFFEKVRS